MNKWTQSKQRREGARDASKKGNGGVVNTEPDVDRLVDLIRANNRPVRDEIPREKPNKRPKVVLSDAQVREINARSNKPTPQASSKSDGEFRELQTNDELVHQRKVDGLVSLVSDVSTRADTLTQVRARMSVLSKMEPDRLVSSGVGGSFTLPLGKELTGLVRLCGRIGGRGFLVEADLITIDSIMGATPANSILHVSARNALIDIQQAGTNDEKRWAIALVKQRSIEGSKGATSPCRESTPRSQTRGVDRSLQERAQLIREIRADLRQPITPAIITGIVTKLNSIDETLPHLNVDEEERKFLGIIARDTKLGAASERAKEILTSRGLPYELQKAQPLVYRDPERREPLNLFDDDSPRPIHGFWDWI